MHFLRNTLRYTIILLNKLVHLRTCTSVPGQYHWYEYLLSRDPEIPFSHYFNPCGHLFSLSRALIQISLLLFRRQKEGNWVIAVLGFKEAFGPKIVWKLELGWSPLQRLRRILCTMMVITQFYIRPERGVHAAGLPSQDLHQSCYLSPERDDCLATFRPEKQYQRTMSHKILAAELL